MPKFHVNQYLHLSRIDSGIDSLKAEMSGHEKAFWSLPMHFYDEEEGLVPDNLLVESEQKEVEEEEDDGEDVEGEVAQHRELGDREVGCVLRFFVGTGWKVEASRWR